MSHRENFYIHLFPHVFNQILFDLNALLYLYVGTLDKYLRMHKQNIVHRDIKPDNILFIKSKDKLSLRLIDFGYSGLIRSGEE